MSDAEKNVLEALRKIPSPEGEGNIVDSGLVSRIVIADAKAFFSISAPPEKAASLEPLRKAAEKAALSVEGINQASVVLTAERVARTTPPGGSTGSPSASPVSAAPPAHDGLARVGATLAIASGKGGVGKSTASANLSLAFQSLGLRVGLLDADIHGPSIPRILGIEGQARAGKERSIEPREAFGLKVMSMGFLVEDDRPIIWRAPMVVSALGQMLKSTEWGELDLLVIDMPPGTGDVQLSLAQSVPLSGAAIVSTPQDLALLDARKALETFRKVEAPVLGIIENMSFFLCPDCGARHSIFGHGGAKKEAERLGVPFLGEIPLVPAIREASDRGKPELAENPEGETARICREIAERIREGIESARPQVQQPDILFE